ncbi:MAG: choice-of-anchor D domain-containing protein [Rhodocyclaceae bacterium]|nr:choice-of-anchor D domain-containing protein [Rhodocyclaceae bacterium]
MLARPDQPRAQARADAAQAHRIHFEALEPRLLLSADLLGSAAAGQLDATLVPNESVNVSVHLQNQGDAAPAAAVRLELRASLDATLSADDSLVGFADVAAADLAPGADTQVQISVSSSAVPAAGSYQLIASIDPASQIPENDETNNSFSVPGTLDVNWGFGTVPGHAGNALLKLMDADGSLVQFALSGPGSGQVSRFGDAFDVTLTGSNTSTVVSITASGGDGRASLHDFVADASLASLNAPAADLGGNIQIHGSLGVLTLGDVADPHFINIDVAGATGLRFTARHVQDLSLSSAGPIAQINVADWHDSDRNDLIRAPSINQISSSGDFMAGLELTGASQGFTLLAANIGGTLGSGLWNVSGRALQINAQSIAPDWMGSFTSALQMLNVRADMSGMVATPALQILTVGGDLTNARLFIGANLGSDGQFGGSGSAADSFGPGTLARLRVSGDIVDTQIRVGVDPVDGIYDNGNDQLISVGGMQEISVGGAMSGDTTIQAANLPLRSRIGGATVTTTSLSQFQTQPVDTVAPIVNLALAQDSGSSSSDFITSDPTVSGVVTEAGSVAHLLTGVDSADSADWVDLIAQLAGNTFTLNRSLLEQVLPGPLADGTHTVYVQAVDAAGNAAEVVQLTMQLDTTRPAAPQLALDPASDSGAPGDGITNDNTPTINLSGEAGASLALLQGGLPTGDFVLGPSGQITPALLADGDYEFSATATDLAGNVSNPATPLVINIDTLAPATPAFDLAPASDSPPLGDQQTTDAAVTLAGTTDPGAAVQLLETGATTTADAGGTFQFELVALALGANGFTVRATDLAGNSAEASNTITRTAGGGDDTPPQLSAQLANDSGADPGDGYTNDAGVAGTASDDTAVTALTAGLDGATPASFFDIFTSLDAGGQFSLSQSDLDDFAGGMLADGAHVLHLVVADAAGNTASLDVPFTLDRTPPVAPTFDLDSASDTPPAGDQQTSDAVVTLIGSTDAGAAVELLDTGATATAASSGLFHFDLVLLALGSNSFTVRATDLAGNSTDASNIITRTAVVDNTPPQLAAQLANDSGADPGDGITNDAGVAGTASDDSAVTALTAGLDGATPASFFDIFTSLDAGGQFSLSQSDLDGFAGGTLADGAHVLHLVASDAAGNMATLDVPFTLDRTPPIAPAFDLDSASDSAPAGDQQTTDAIVTLVGATDPAAAVALLETGATGSANGSGMFQFELVALTLGSNSFTVRATDLAGNSTDASNIITRLPGGSDAIAPQLSAQLSNDTGTSASDAITMDPSFTGSTSDDTGVSLLQAGLDGTPPASFFDIFAKLDVAGHFVLTPGDLDQFAGGTLTDGAHVLHLVAGDAAGNQTSIDISFTLDRSAPGVPSAELAATDQFGDPLTTQSNTATLVGQTEAGARLSLSSGATTLASNNGSFQFANVALALGSNLFTVTSTDAAGNSNSASLSIERVAQAAAENAVLSWNRHTLDAITADGSAPPFASRTLAMQSLAVLDAINALNGTPGYLVRMSATPGSSADAAVAAASHKVLTTLYPTQSLALDAVYNSFLAGVADGSSKTNGIALGEAVAMQVLALRAGDGWNAFVTYDGGTAVGQWRPTAPGFDNALLPQWATLQPFALTSPDQFRPAGPPELNSPEYAEAVTKTQLLGRATGSTRTPDQTEIARFWADGMGTYTPSGHWNVIAEQAALDSQISLTQSALLFAQLNVAQADAGIAAWDAKYFYGAWRPINAIQDADLIGNPGITQDADWEPLLISPNFPEYVSGHSTYSGAGAQILTEFFGDNYAFSVDSASLPGVTRNYASFWQAAQEAGESRIYGGIHFEFANQDGLAAGSSVADWALRSFDLAQDVAPPRVSINQADGLVTNQSLVVTGQVLDNLSGVASLQAQLDGGTSANVAFDGNGNFSFATQLATDGTADGAHLVVLRAADAAGNQAQPINLHFTLDTRAPTLLLGAASVHDGDSLSAASHILGTADATGSSLSALNYRFDGGTPIPLGFNAVTGVFDQALTLTTLGVGAHTLTVTATDRAGNSAQSVLDVNLPDLVALTVSGVTPMNGASEVGVTFHPRVIFSRAVNTATLTPDSFYATDAAGTALAAIIVPAADKASAWLFFNSALPGSSSITLHVVGSKIRGLADGQFLDAANSGVTGSELLASFTTVSTTAVPGTVLTGKLVDPGPDLQPMTFDDVRAGPDQILHTADDVYLNPIAHVKVFILGRESEAVFTDAQGNFTLSNVPAGDVKVAVDGRTATNAPAGYYFPEMVMDSIIKPGIVNTLMGSMGSVQKQAANADDPAVYLPRLQNAIFATVSATQPTVITAPVESGAGSGSRITGDQLSQLTLTIQPGSVVDANGNAIDNAQVGVSPVPATLVRDMLPPGVLQHTFDITIQAPDAAAFTTPAMLTMPNVFGMAPGEKTFFLSFDHTTGRLVIDGTATVSADGLTVVTDPGQGVTMPGWHGLTPPGGCGGSGGPPPQPVPPSPTETVNENDPTALPLITGEAAATIFTRTWNAPPENPNAPSLPPIPGCEVPQHNPGTNQQPFINVTIELDGPLDKFAKQSGDLALTGQSFTLSPGSGSKTLAFDTKTYTEMFGANGFRGLSRDQLYGAKLKITVIEQKPNGDRIRTIDTIVFDRWVDVIDAAQAKDHKGDTAVFQKAFVDNITREKKVDVFLPASLTTDFTGGGMADFDYGAGVSGSTTATWKFDPNTSGDKNENLTLETTVTKDDGTTVDLNLGTLKVHGRASDKIIMSIDLDGYKTEFIRVINALQNVVVANGVDGLLGTADDVKDIVYDYGGGISTVANPNGPGTVTHVSDNTKVQVASAVFKAQFAQYMPGFIGPPSQSLADAATAEATALRTAISTHYKTLVDAGGIAIQDANAGADVTMMWKDLGAGLAGNTSKYDYDFATMRTLLGTQGRTDPVTANTYNLDVSEAAQQYLMAELMNLDKADTGNFSVAIQIAGNGPAAFADFVANTVSHELAHTLGLNEAYKVNPIVQNGTAKVNAQGFAFPYDIMGPKDFSAGVTSFNALSMNLMKAGLGLQANGELGLQNELNMWRDNFNLINGINNVDGLQDLLDPNALQGPDIRLIGADDTFYGYGDELLDFSSLAADGAGGVLSTLNFDLQNWGDQPLTLGAISLSGSGAAAYALGGVPAAGTVLAAGDFVTLSLTFDPTTVGLAEADLSVASDAAQVPQFHLALAGTAISAGPVLNARADQNNLGGMTIGGTPLAAADIATLTNTGAAPLLITGITLAEGGANFTLTGLPADLALSPIVLATGESFSFGATFQAGQLGLARAQIDVASNDALHPVMRLSAVGTGITALPAVQWGDDYFGIENPDFPGVQPLNAVSDATGNFSFFLPGNQHYHLVGYDPATDLVTHGYGTTAASGKATDVTATLVFAASTERDSDFDGLPDDVEFAIGSGAGNRDTNRDGIDDFAAVKQGLDPRSGFAIPNGIVASTALDGTARAVAVTGSAQDPTQLTAYVATGEYGLAIVDVSRFTRPEIAGQIDLNGVNGDVSVDPLRQIAAVAGGTAGLHLVDVSDPAAPQLTQSVLLADPVTRVEVRDGLAFVAAGKNIATIDLNTGEVRQTLNLSALGGATLTDLVFEGERMYSMDTLFHLRAYDVAGDTLAPRGSITLAGGAGKLFAGNDIVYVEAGNGGNGGYLTVDASDPDNLVLASGIDNNGLSGTAIALNGSGLGVAVGSSSFVFGAFRALDLLNVSDPTNTNNLVTRIDLPQVPFDVALANGLAFVADGTGGLQIVNYLSFDPNGVAPVVSINVSAIDVDPVAPGIQVLEGSTVHVLPLVSDDVQVRNVELLVNGVTAVNDPAFPFDLSAFVPLIAAGGSSAAFQVRATDTGGNSALSAVVNLDVVPDTFPPQLLSSSLAEGDRRFFVRSIDFRFDEALDTTLLTPGSASLVNKGVDGTAGTPDDVIIPLTLDAREFGQNISVVPSIILPAGEYRLEIAAAAIADRAGNAFGAAIVRNFTIRPASEVRAASGVPAIAQAPSANPGQSIDISVPFDPSTARATFLVIDSSGTQFTRELQAASFNAAQGTARFVVPFDAVTGDITVFSQVGNTITNFPDGTFPLQIVPVLSGVDVTSVASNGSSANITLNGLGFIEGNNSEYHFGNTTLVDNANNSGPDVFFGSNANGRVNLTLPLSADAFGTISVATAGGTSAPLDLDLTGITGAALSGTPADPGQASANAGQAVTLSGSGLSTSSDLLLRYITSGGTPQMVLLNPTNASNDGSSATLIVPGYANGAFELQMVGASGQPLLQVVPELTSYNVSGSTLQLFGSALVEDAATYNFAGATLTDNVAGAGPNVFFQSAFDNTGVNITEGAHGLGQVSVSTAGGESAPLALNEFSPGLGFLRDVAIDRTSGAMWVADNASPVKLNRIDPATGAVLQGIPLSTAAFGSTSLIGGLQVVPQAFSLNGTPVAAGSLLLFNGTPSPDRVIAVDPATGNVIASLVLGANYDTTAGEFDPSSGHLFLLARNGTQRIVEIDPSNGAEISSFTTPFNGGEAGLAFHPVSGNLWFGSDQSTNVVELSRSGQLLRTLSVVPQGVDQNEITGLAFDAAGNLFASSSQGVVYSLALDFDTAITHPVLAAIAAAAADGTPANAGLASANVGQVISLSGSNFGANTEVVFATRSNTGDLGNITQTPLAVSPDGSQLQVQVPDLARTGDVRVVNISARNLGFGSTADAIYRDVTLNFTAGGASAVLRFADDGLQGVSDESWGLDNVRVLNGASTVYAENFEAGAGPEWSDSSTDNTVPGIFTRFSGRFSNSEQLLTLNGLTPGQQYSLKFDLYILDTWDGLNASNGPDLFEVSADGQLLLREAFAAGLGNVQTFNASDAITLQIVPTLTGIANGRPGEDSFFDLLGSGFQEGASSVTVGGRVYTDAYPNLNDFDVFGSRNSTFRIVTPLALDGPIRVTTDGGWAQIAGPVFGSQSVAQFTGIDAVAQSGTPANAALASANTGQSIVLTGQGFNFQTLVQFEGADDNGQSGLITRTGSASGDGSTLTVDVPALAKTGLVHVLGSDDAFMLQIVPVLRSLGGNVVPGNTLALEGTGLVSGELQLQVDGRGVGIFNVRTTYDTNAFSSQPDTQQILTLTVPAGAALPVLTVSTAGGTNSLRTGASVQNNPDAVLGADAGDTIATALNLALGADRHVNVLATLGDGAEAGNDVDLYRVDAAAGETLRIGLSGDFFGNVRVFDGAGNQLDLSFFSTSGSAPHSFLAPAAGSYYLGVAGSPNSGYDPNLAGSGNNFGSVGAYQLSVERRAAGSSLLTGVSATAARGTAAQAGIAAANVGQTITLAGSSLAPGEIVMFTTQDSGGTLGQTAVTAASVAGDGSSLTVDVPQRATTGTVRLLRDAVGQFLQIVPTLDLLQSNAGSSFASSFLTLAGSGYAEGGTSVLFGASVLPDSSRQSGNDVFDSFATGGFVQNGGLSVMAPAGVVSGPIRVATVGGTSDTPDISLSGIVASASSGTPANAALASANPGQNIVLQGSGLDLASGVVFATVNSAGTRSEVIVNPWAVAADGSSAQVLVPDDAVTGTLRLIGDNNSSALALQIVPVVTGVDATSVASNGSTVNVQLSGGGFVEDSASAYHFGSTTVVDASSGAGPDVFAGNLANSRVNLTLPLTPGLFGAITVSTEGGTSAPFAVGLSGITGSALSGTPADAGQASANAGQAVTLLGSNFTTASDLLLRYVASSGSLQSVLVNPTAVAPDGTSATLIVPGNANGAFALQRLGASGQPLLQVVPSITGYNVSGGTLQLFGNGLAEDAASYQLAGTTVDDHVAGAGPNVFFQSAFDNTGVNITEPVHGLGSVTVTTDGGTSAPFALNEFDPNLGTLRDVAIDTASGAIWVGDTTNPAKLNRIDIATGAVLQSIPFTSGGFGSTSFLGGLQVVPAAFSLNGSNVPVGSLLVFNGSASPDRVIALDPASGNVIASLTLGVNYDTSAGVYDPFSGNLFLLARNGTQRILEINPANGAEISSFTPPFNGGEAGLAIDPVSHNLWFGSDQSTNVVELSRTGAVLRTLSLAPQGVDQNETTGLAFDAAGRLYVASTQGVVYRVALDFDPAVTRPLLTSIGATASDGTPFNAGIPSANVGQIITLSGSNFGPNTEIVFQTRDNDGQLGSESQSPLAIDADGTQMQVQVPDLARTAELHVVNISAQNFGFGSSADAIYRNVTLDFTAAGSSASLRFADGGLQGINDESWGLDNVRIMDGATPLFVDDFEAGTQPEWSDAGTDNSVPGIFTRFSGRYSNGEQTLALAGLTPGHQYTLSFDLYIIDTWDGSNPSTGPDQFEVSVDGQVLLNEVFAAGLGNVQTYNASAALPLQIVPTLSAVVNGRPGEDNFFDLTGSGFQEGASTIMVGGVSYVDNHTNLSDFDVFGTRNSDYRIVAPLALDGPISVTTDGGTATLPGPAFASPAPVDFAGIEAVAQSGTPADPGQASANTGQSIVLTGHGFSFQTLVQFTGMDDSGQLGTLTRSGNASFDGTTLTVMVPALAKTGLVQVVGSASSFNLQIVPTLRGLGGTVAAGNTLEIDASGLAGDELTVQVDGQDVNTWSLRTLFDADTFVSQPDTQQILLLTVPVGASTPLISVSTAGGSAFLRTGVAVTDDADDIPAADVGDTIATAHALMLAPDHRVNVQATLGDGAQAGNDVDLYAVDLAAGDFLRLDMSGAFFSDLRVFDAAGTMLTNQFFATSGTQPLVFTAPAAGSYFIGVSSSSNSGYDPNVAGSGNNFGQIGAYQLGVERRATSSSILTGISAAATRGTPAQSGIASANAGQTIQLLGSGLSNADQIVFTSQDANGNLRETAVNPSAVAADGSSLSVVVPNDAATGSVRLARDPVGLFLQVVPTLDDVAGSTGSQFAGSNVQLIGSGFAEGAIDVLFGADVVHDSSRQTGADVFNAFVNSLFRLNGGLNVIAPAAAPSGPIRVVTAGGTSDSLQFATSAINALAASGTPADALAASANAGQTITLLGSGFALNRNAVFETINTSGGRGEIQVQPSTVAADGTSATYVVPDQAVTGFLRVLGDTSGNAFRLQIVPVVSGADVTSVQGDGSSANVQLSGSGFVEDSASAYRFGTTTIKDAAAGTGPDVFSSGGTNNRVNVTVPLSDGSFGAITVQTEGGTSASFSVAFTGITAVAASGTPADAGQASANAGQTITLLGSGYTTASDILLRYVTSSGSVQMLALNPATAAPDGTSATLLVPGQANGAFALQRIGATGQPLLQVVPTLTGYNVSGSTLQLFGSALVEDAASYQFEGGVVDDFVANAGPNVFFQSGFDNTGVNLTEPAHGLGNVTVTTAGGTSDPLVLNELNPNLGLLRDVAIDQTTGTMWVADSTNPTKLNRVDMTTGAVLQSIPFTVAGFGSTSFIGGLQIAPAAFTLNGTAVAAGSLLVFNGTPNADRVIAVDPVSGSVIATLTLAANYDTTAGVFDAASGHLFVLARNGTQRIVEIDPSNGAEISSFNTPFNAGEAGLAIHPITGNLWFGSDQSTNLVELSSTGVVLRTLSIASQGVDQNEVSGLAFDAAGNLYASSTQGRVYKLSVA